MSQSQQTGIGEHVPVHQSRALESMRNTDFDTKTALGEAIDNSIEAESDNIKIQFKRANKNKGRGPNKWRANEIAVGDDGHGMDPETLERCLQLGFGTRYQERSTIGRFGVGVTLGSISQCRDIEMFSKEPGGRWHYTYLDLDEIRKEGENARLPKPQEVKPPEEYQHLIGKDSGTLLIWKNIDRASTLRAKEVDEFTHWVGRTYRKWLLDEKIDDDRSEVVENKDIVDITIYDIEEDNDREEKDIRPFDPLFVTPYIKEDPSADLQETIEIEIDIDDEGVDKTIHGEKDVIKVRLSLLPKELRGSGFGGTKEGKKRHLGLEEGKAHCGVSILRKGREVYYGSSDSFLGTFPSVDGTPGSTWIKQGDRYWGCEIEFPPTLDNKFRVRNIKTGAKPVKEVSDKLKKEMVDTIITFRKEIKTYWGEEEEENESNKSINSTVHEKAEEIVNEISTTEAPEDHLTKEEEKRVIESLIGDKDKDSSELSLKDLTEEFGKYKLVGDEQKHPRGPLFEIIGKGGHTIISYTSDHPFFKQIDREFSRMEPDDANPDKKISSSELKENIMNLRAAIDFLLMGYVDSRNKILSSMGDSSEVEKEIIKEVFDKQLIDWGFFLKNAIDRYMVHELDE